MATSARAKAIQTGKRVQIIDWHGKKFLFIKLFKILIEFRLSISLVEA